MCKNEGAHLIAGDIPKDFFDLPTGFLGLDSWANWFIGDTIADRTNRERSKMRTFYEVASNPNQQAPVNRRDNEGRS